MRLFVSTVVAVVVLALWLPVTADFDYAVTAAEHMASGGAHGKSYMNLLFATGATLYATAGLFRFGGPAQDVRVAHRKPPLRQRGPGQVRAGKTAAGGYKRIQKKPSPKTKQQPARSSSKGTLSTSSWLEGRHVSTTTGNLAQSSPPPPQQDTPALGAVLQAHAVSKKARRRVAAKNLASCAPAPVDVGDAATEQVDAEKAAVEQPSTAQEWQLAAGRCEGGFTMAPCGKRYYRLGKHLLHSTQLPVNQPAAAGGCGAAKRPQPQGRLVTIEEQLPSLHLQLQHVPGEGDCQFCSVALLLEGSWKNHLQLRQQVCDHMAGNEALFAPFVSASSLASYLQGMRRPCAWGDELTLMAMADLLRRELRVVVDYHEGEQGAHRYKPLGGPTVNEPIFMWFRHGHYNPLLPQ